MWLRLGCEGLWFMEVRLMNLGFRDLWHDGKGVWDVGCEGLGTSLNQKPSTLQEPRVLRCWVGSSGA